SSENLMEIHTGLAKTRSPDPRSNRRRDLAQGRFGFHSRANRQHLRRPSRPPTEPHVRNKVALLQSALVEPAGSLRPTRVPAITVGNPITKCIAVSRATTPVLPSHMAIMTKVATLTG